MKVLILKGRCVVFVDWANVYGWTKTLKREVDLEALFCYLRTYEQIQEVRLYFGTDRHPKSVAFLEQAHRIGYIVVTKPVKHILVAEVDGRKVYRRKCDFDMETCIDVHRALRNGVKSFIFFTGDGDFEPLYRMLIEEQKQVVVVYMYHHLGMEIFQMRRGIYKVSMETLERKYGSRLTK